MIKILRKNYSTYVDTALGEPERHFSRFAFFVILSLVFALFAPRSVSSVYSMMATGITVLMGFTFTALFSDHALPSVGLPKSRNENDRQDLVRLEILSDNFSARSSYFIIISILEIIFLVAASFRVNYQNATMPLLLEVGLAPAVLTRNLLQILMSIVSIFSVAFAFLINFIYLECLYTFYRMAETILAILDTRRTYLKARREDEV